MENSHPNKTGYINVHFRANGKTNPYKVPASSSSSFVRKEAIDEDEADLMVIISEIKKETNPSVTTPEYSKCAVVIHGVFISPCEPKIRIPRNKENNAKIAHDQRIGENCLHRIEIAKPTWMDTLHYL